MEHLSYPEQFTNSPILSNPTVEALRIRRELARLRKESGLTQQQVAQSCDWHVSKLNRIEGSKTKISKNDLDALLFLYAVGDPQIHRQLHASRLQTHQKSWWEGKTSASIEHCTYIDYEAAALRVLQVETGVLPGPLQIPEYTRAIEEFAPGLSELYAMRPQASPRSRQSYVLDQGLISRRVGADFDANVMPAQLTHLASLAKSQQAEIRVIPFTAGAHPGMLSSFTLFSLAGIGEILYRRGVGFDESEDNAARVSHYQNHFQQLITHYALPVEPSIALIRQVAASMQSS